MTCLVILEIKLKKDLIEEFRAWERKILPDTRGFPGCASLSVVQNQDEPTSIAVLTQWDSRKQFESYFNWRNESGVFPELMQMLDGAPSLRYFDYFGV